MRRDVTGSLQAKIEAACQADSDLAALRACNTPAEVDAWVNANVTTMAEARRALKILFKLVLLRLGR